MKLILLYKDFSKLKKNQSHVGLGITAGDIACVLGQHGYPSEAVPVTSHEEILPLVDVLAPTHVVIGAPWVPTAYLRKLCLAHPGVEFTVACHSNVGFLQTEPAAIRLIFENLGLQDKVKTSGRAETACLTAGWLSTCFRSAVPLAS